MKKVLILALLIVAGFWQHDQNRVIDHAAGVLVSSQPVQRNLRAAPTIQHKGYDIKPQADFIVEARVLSREKYYMDASAELSPLDLTLGWGAMSDTSVIDKLDIEQSVRFYTWRMERATISLKDVIRQSSNMHMIPANDRVADELAEIRKGSLVRISGQLVKVTNPSGFVWNSSMSRTDTGAGACEVVYVTGVSLL